MKQLLTTLVLALSITCTAQTTLSIGPHSFTGVGEKLSSVKYIGSDKKSNSVTNYYIKLGTDSLTIWEEAFDEGEIESISVIRINKKDIDQKNLPYLDVFPGSEYEKPVQRIYIKCAEGECIQSTSYYSWTKAGNETKSTNGFYQIDGSDKAVHQNFLNQLLSWIKN